MNIDPLGLNSGPGGPYHPPVGVPMRCTQNDSCSQISGKMFVLQRMISSHQGWDWHMPSPRGGGRHSMEIAELWRAYARCQSLFSKNCGDNSLSCKENCKETLKESSSATQSNSQLSWGKVLVVGGATILAGVLVLADGPLPFGDSAAIGIMSGALVY